MSKYTNKHKVKQRNTIRKIPIIIVVIVCFSIFAAFSRNRSFWPFSNKDGSISIVEGINYGPPTEDEKKSGDIIKTQVKETEVQKTPEVAIPNQKTDSVSIVITDATQYDNDVEVRAFIPNYLKDGVCTFTFTLGSQNLIKESPAKTDASATICANIVIPRSEFSQAGEWQLIVNFTNEDVNSNSTSQGVIIS